MAIETEQLHRALQDEKNVAPFPEEFIRALEALLDTGLSCAQITAFLIVLRGMSELQDSYDEGELLGKAVEVLRIMSYLRTLGKVQGNEEEEAWFCETDDNTDS